MQKFSLDIGTHGLVSALGGIDPAAAALGAGATAPDGYGVGQAARTGVSSLGGRAIGEAGGDSAGRILAMLLKKDPELFARLGGQLGGRAGGAMGAHVGHQWANNSMMEDMHKQQMGG